MTSRGRGCERPLGSRAVRDHPRTIRDPIYGYVEVPAEFDEVVDHPLYQRLRRVGQMSLTSHVFPGATGSRFEHGLGAMHLGRRAWRAAWRNATDEARRVFEVQFLGAVSFDDGYDVGTAAEIVVAGAALLHDLGHPPFSHILEPYCKARFPVEGDMAYHELVGRQLTPIVLDKAPEWVRAPIGAVLTTREDNVAWDGALHAIVAGEIDIDRLDYLMRDADRTGTEFGGIDYAQLLDSYVLYLHDGALRVAPHTRARRAVESLLVQRVQAYRWVAHHPRAIASSIALVRSLELLDALARDAGARTGAGQTMAEVFAPLRPALNLLCPAENLAGMLPHMTCPDGPDKQTLLQIQAGIDDATVVEALKKAGVAARILEGAGVEADQLRRFRIYVETALNRARSAVTAWKTTDAFRWTAERMAHPLERLLEDIDSERAEALQPLILNQRARFARWLIDELLEHGGPMSALDERLAERVAYADTVEVHQLSFDAVREHGAGARLYDRESGTEVPVVETSELARALTRVAAESPPLRLYAFAEPSIVREHRDRITATLRERFENEFVHLARETLPGYLRERDPDALIRSLSAR